MRGATEIGTKLGSGTDDLSEFGLCSREDGSETIVRDDFGTTDGLRSGRDLLGESVVLGLSKDFGSSRCAEEAGLEPCLDV